MSSGDSPSDGKSASDTAAPDDAAPAARRERRARDPEHWIRRPVEEHRNRSRKKSLAFRPDPGFFDLADAVAKTNRTLLGYDRLYAIWQAIRNVVHIAGAVAEVGSYRGGSAYFIASAFRAATGGDVPLHVFDTFEGHPGDAVSEHDPFHKPGQFGSTSFEDVRAYLSEFPQVEIHRGDVSESLPHLPDAMYRLVHIDTDLYQPTKACLEYFGTRLSSGGIVVVDDYSSRRCPGVPAATVEYLSQTNMFQAWDLRTEQLLLVKR